MLKPSICSSLHNKQHRFFLQKIALSSSKEWWPWIYQLFYLKQQTLTYLKQHNIVAEGVSCNMQNYLKLSESTSKCFLCYFILFLCHLSQKNKTCALQRNDCRTWGNQPLEWRAFYISVFKLSTIEVIIKYKPWNERMELRVRLKWYWRCCVSEALGCKHLKPSNLCKTAK